jgi:hypothetical protein
MAQQDNPPAAPAVPTVAALPAPAAPEVVEAATLPQDAPVVADAPKPTRKRKAAQEASTTAPAAKDGYPDEYEGLFVIQRVVRRPGKPVAVQAAGEHGTAWIAATVPEYADVCERAIDGELRLAVDRVNGSLTIMRVMALAPKPAAPVAAEPAEDKEELPF